MPSKKPGPPVRLHTRATTGTGFGDTDGRRVKQNEHQPGEIMHKTPEHRIGTSDRSREPAGKPDALETSIKKFVDSRPELSDTLRTALTLALRLDPQNTSVDGIRVSRKHRATAPRPQPARSRAKPSTTLGAVHAGGADRPHQAPHDPT